MGHDASLLAVCGRFCGNCVRHLGGSCLGCSVHGGRPSWGECLVYSCVREHGVLYYGLCGEFPCDLIMSYCDPANPEGPRNAAIRVAVSAYRARHGDGKTLEYFERVGALNKPVE